MEKSRWLVQTLILSLIFNLFLLALFFYFVVKEPALHFPYKPKIERIEKEPPLTPTLLGRLHTLTFEQLVDLLTDERKLEYGYRLRDLALSALVLFYEFDVERGVGKGPLATRKWELSDRQFNFYPELEETDYERLQKFARCERWPLTPKGLFQLLQKRAVDKSEPELISYFCHTPHFVLLETLFARTHLPIQKKNLLALVMEMGWEGLERFYQQEQKEGALSAETRRQLLVEALESQSKIAAYLLILTDPSYALKELEDRRLLRVLELLTVKTEEALRFVQLVTNSPRGERVQVKALDLLAHYEASDREALAGHFYEKPGLKNLRPSFREQPPAAPSPTMHLIQPGESLWLISKKYQVSLERLMEANHLNSTFIQPGKSLHIPLP